VGMHVAKAIWAMKKALPDGDITDDVLATLTNSLGSYYAEGAAAYDNDEQAAEQIRSINEHVYKEDDETINTIHKWGSERSFGYFDEIFNELGISYEPSGRYLESVTTKVGVDFVRKHTGSVFEESDGAIIYRGEKVGLHTRVFINSKGLPTYEAKDLGLAELKNQDYPNASKSIIITANEQTEYFKVMLAALSEFDAELAAKTKHIAHGFLSLTTGKMSSRSGNVFSASDLMSEVKSKAKELYPESDIQQDVYLAALKYTFLKNRIGGDIVFDVNESVSLEGNSGPYLQYAHARARSILRKAEPQDVEFVNLEEAERSLLRKVSEYAEVVDKAVFELMPHHICTYLYELAQTFNRFYEHNRVIDDPREAVRLQLVVAYADTLKAGLELLNISAPDKM
jgi:arginyl-tRNA synthetase